MVLLLLVEIELIILSRFEYMRMGTARVEY